MVGPPRVIPRLALLGSRSTAVFLVALGIVSCAFHTWLAAPTVTGEDSGELITAAATGGVAHPPGYPLWTMLGRLFSLLPFGEVAFRVTLVSCVFAALTTVTLAAVALVLSGSRIVATATGLGFALLREPWCQAEIAEVYTLGTFVLSAAFLLLLVDDHAPSRGRLALLGLSLGLGFSNHFTMAAAVPFVVLFLVVSKPRRWLDLRNVRAFLLGCAGGLLPYLYLPLAARGAPALNWGDPSTFDRFLDHVTRSQYRRNGPTVAGDPSFADQISTLAEHFVGQGGLVLLVAGLAGLALAPRGLRRISAVLLGTCLLGSVGLVRILGTESDFESTYALRVFLIPAYLALSLGLPMLATRLLPRFGPQLASIVACALAAACVLPQAVTNFESADYRRFTLASEYGRALLLAAPKDAILIPSADHDTFALVYLQDVHGLRPDLTIADRCGYLEPSILRGSPFEAEIGSPKRNLPTFRVEAIGWLVENSGRPVLFTRKTGLFSRTHALASESFWYVARPRPEAKGESPQNVSDPAVSALRSRAVSMATPMDYSAQVILADLAFADARGLLVEGRMEEALSACRAAVDHLPRVKEVANNVASLLAEHGEHESSWPFFRHALALDPDYQMAARNLGISLWSKRALSEARVVLEGVLRRDPTDGLSLRILSELARDRKDWPAAADLLSRLGRRDSDPIALRDAGLMTLFELKQEAPAQALLRASLALDSRQPDIAELERKIDGELKRRTSQAAAETAREGLRPAAQDIFEEAAKKRAWADPKSVAPSLPEAPTASPWSIPGMDIPGLRPNNLQGGPGTQSTPQTKPGGQ